ncbi:MAG: hypothetical protein CHACPFDD_00185 [Phycisphaerae bacterium]|nr:hypothetical protein [Phycisphaerae bacterium]
MSSTIVRRGTRCTLALVAAASAMLASTGMSQTLIDMGRFPGGTYSFSANLSDDGSVVTGSGDLGGKMHAWRWTMATGLVDLGVVPGATRSAGYCVSGNGQVIVGVSGASYDVAARWTAQTGMQSLGSLAAGKPSFAFGTTYDGAIVVGDGYLSDGTQRAFRWTSATGLQQFGQRLPGTLHSLALRINGDGSVITGYCYNNAPSLVYPTACVWDAAGNITSLGTLPGSAESVPGAINTTGDTIVGYCANGDGSGGRPFRWTAATGMQDLGLPPGATAAVAAALTADGATVVGHAIEAGQARATIWTAATGNQYLSDVLQAAGVDLTGWFLRHATISADGSAMAGWGIYNGAGTSWYLTFGCVAPTILSGPASQTVTEGSSVSFTVVATGSALQYAWFKDSVQIPGAIAATYTIAAVTASDAGDYHCVVSNGCGADTSNIATLTVQPCAAPQITQQPLSQTVNVGMPAYFSVGATGTDPLTYQWRKNTQNIPGATASQYQIAAVTEADAGDYDCIVTNACGGATSSVATLTVQGGGCTGPQISQHPQSQTVDVGMPAYFFVIATGTDPLSYQWRKDALDIPGATAQDYLIAAVTEADAGDYDCVVTNACGSATSFAATLTVQAGCTPPQITQHPQDQTVDVGDSADFLVAATGTGTLSYQWRKDGVAIPGADENSFEIPSVVHADTGLYDCVVTDDCGSSISNAAALTVMCEPCDANCDGSINGFDVEDFVAALSGSGSGCSPCQGDVNGDGSVNGFDIDGFVQCLTGP